MKSHVVKTASLTAVIFSLLTFLACGGGYYVDFAGGSDTNLGTTMSAPFKHCPGDATAASRAASTELVAGDIVYFKGGVVYSNPVITCSSGSLVCTGDVAAISSAGVLTDSTANFSSVQSGDLLYIYNGVTNGAFVDSCGMWSISNVMSATMLQLQGFNGVQHDNSELTYIVCRPITFASTNAFGTGKAVFDGGNTNIREFCFNNFNRFTGLTFQNANTTNGYGCLYVNNGRTYYGLFVENCLFTNVWRADYLASTPMVWGGFRSNSCVDLGSYALVGGNYFLFEYNYVSNSVGGVRNTGAYSVIRFNQILDSASNAGSHSDGIGPIFSPSANPFSNGYGWIYGNWIENAVQGIFLTYGTTTAGGTMGWTIANNVLVGTHGNTGTGNGSFAIYVECAPGTRIYNNTILGNGGQTGWIAGIHVGDRDLTNDASSGVEIKNNLFCNYGTGNMGAIHVYSSALTNGFACEGNLYYFPNEISTYPAWTVDNNPGESYSQWQISGFDAGGYSTYGIDPQLINPASSPVDARLQSTSPARNSAYSLPVDLRDAGGTLRLSNTLWDRGAYQVSTNASAQSGPTPPSGLRVVGP